jgi:UDP-N-acetylmuramate-alanine ligase
MLSYILLEAGMDPSYFTGAVSLSHETGALPIPNGASSKATSTRPQFGTRRPNFFTTPTHLLTHLCFMGSCRSLPHRKSYFDAFRKIVAEIPDSGLIVACADEKGIVKVLGNKKAVTYGKKSADFIYHSISHTLQGLSFGIRYDDEEYKIESPMLGRFNVENITGAFAMAYSIGIPAEKIIAALKKFKGIKRRLEKRYEGEVTIFDCHGPTAEKAASNLESLREVYSGKIIAVYEPNTGSRQHANAYMYDDAFKNADSVIIPRLTKIKVDAGASEKAFEGKELAEVISKTHPHCRYIESDEELVATLRKEAEKSCVIAFIGSHGFRGMIEETIQAFGKRNYFPSSTISVERVSFSIFLTRSVIPQ